MASRRVTEEFLSAVKARLRATFADRFCGVVLYGSEARGDARADSDVDLLVLLRGPVHLGADAWTAVQATYDLELAQDPILPLSLIPVDVDAYARRESPLYLQASLEGVAL